MKIGDFRLLTTSASAKIYSPRRDKIQGLKDTNDIENLGEPDGTVSRDIDPHDLSCFRPRYIHHHTSKTCFSGIIVHLHSGLAR